MRFVADDADSHRVLRREQDGLAVGATRDYGRSMAQPADSQGQPTGVPRVRKPTRPASAPARPDLGGEGFAASIEVGGPPASVTTSVGLWLGSIAAGAFALVIVWLEQNSMRERFAATVVAQDPTTAADVVADAARFAFLGAWGSLVLVAVLHLTLALLMRTGRTWARNLLVVTGVAGVVVAGLVQDVMSDPDRALLRDVGRLGLLVQAALILAALVAMLQPGARRWFRRARVLR